MRVTLAGRMFAAVLQRFPSPSKHDAPDLGLEVRYVRFKTNYLIEMPAGAVRTRYSNILIHRSRVRVG